MKANPGGQIDLRDVIGRDEIIAQIWDTLEQQSIRMNAERRIGKTTIINSGSGAGTGNDERAGVVSLG